MDGGLLVQALERLVQQVNGVLTALLAVGKGAGNRYPALHPAGKLLRNIRLFDVYRGTGVPEGKKSLAFSLELRADDRTLTDTDSETVTKNVLDALENQLGAVLR